MTPPSPAATAKWASYLNQLNPIPSFPDYTGPHKVGTVDVEIPVSELESPTPAPANSDDIHTVQFRIFYPATPESDGKRITWLPNPQRSHLAGYTQFLGAGPLLSEFLSVFPRHVHYTTIPAYKNASLLDCETPNKQWPTMIFSHGLGGTRNAYSHIAGSIASHGVVVICPEHRDGSAVVSFVRDPAAQDRYFRRSRRTAVPYRRIEHKERPEVWAARNDQLRIRLWELGLIHDAVLRLQKDGGSGLTNLNTSTPASCLSQLTSRLDVEEPGKIIWAGHSFGAATVVQLLKSTFYASRPDVAAIPNPLFTPSPTSRLRTQITPRSPTILMDMWCFALVARSMRPLYNLPLPCYADAASSAGSNPLLAVESEAFYKWTAHLHTMAKVISPNPAAVTVEASAFETQAGVKLREPNFFYVEKSAHVNQSDFGILFPFLCRRVFDAAEPERVLRLNLRAVLQHLRANEVPIARTWVGDLVDGADGDKLDIRESDGSGKGVRDGVHDDKAIFDRAEENGVESWKWIDIVGMGEQAVDKLQADADEKKEGKLGGEDAANVEASEARLEREEEQIGAEVEPTVSRESAVTAVQAMASTPAAVKA